MTTVHVRPLRAMALCSAGLATALVVAACGVGEHGADDQGDADGASGEIRATWWGGDSENQAVNAALDSYAANAGIQITRESQAWDGYWDRLATQTAARNAPDLVMQAGSQIPDYASRGALLDLATVDALDVDVVDEGLQQFGAVEEELYGVVAAANAMGLVVNNAVLADVGASMPEGAYNWEDLAVLAEQISESSDDGTWGLSDGGGDLILFILAVRDDGRQFYDDDGALNATPEDLTAWLEYWDDLRDRDVVPPADVTAEGQGMIANSPIAQSAVGLGFGWTQDYVAFTRLMDDPLNLHLPPHNAENPSLWMNAASLWSVSASSADPDAAVDAINYLTNDPDAIAELGVSLGMPPSQEARDLLTGELSAEEQEAMDYMDDVAETSTPLNRLWPGGFAELRTLLSELNESVAFGQTTVPDAVDEFFDSAAQFE